MSALEQHIDHMRMRAMQGGALLGSYAEAAPTAHSGQIVIIDDVLADPEAYRQQALALPFRSVDVGTVTFHGIAECADPVLPLAIVEEFPTLTPTLTFFRKSPATQVEPNFIHTDRDMGEWTGIFYLNPDPPQGDGTSFWRHKASGAQSSTAPNHEALVAEWLEWRDVERWERWTTVEAKFNRLLLFSAPLFHSRAILENYGTGDEARLIQLVFGTGALPCA